MPFLAASVISMLAGATRPVMETQLSLRLGIIRPRAIMTAIRIALGIPLSPPRTNGAKH
jgi:hypothetical protein